MQLILTEYLKELIKDITFKRAEYKNRDALNRFMDDTKTRLNRAQLIAYLKELLKTLETDGAKVYAPENFNW